MQVRKTAVLGELQKQMGYSWIPGPSLAITPRQPLGTGAGVPAEPSPARSPSVQEDWIQ